MSTTLLMALSHAVDMASILARRRLFVSTQAIENFTSLAMLEAMAAGNAVIAEDVGQTGEFVHHRVNGYLVRPASAGAFAEAIAAYLENPGAHDAMVNVSCALVTDVQTLEHFADDITLFWQDLRRRANTA
jgi:glycosyltransferase involved in cell wall biosynthesis